MALHIKKAFTNGTTGHIEVHVRHEEKNGNSVSHGLVTVCGISPEALTLKYNGNTQAWLADIHKELKAKHEAMKNVNDSLTKLAGTTMDFD